ncbi:hypothetical protein IQ273_24790 [Nodosilinea sp. LEGE 07298]|uniref:hypothetical protein n=1 Tax=Nodosilinea sp. LEGE 07298 TaxID=2777970 RepID=UPI00187DF4EA|nr:hypothetical protein [Nodosilinea sp. LEGE 07298]MBE9112613.1 hypothetical protein [Nodosilinea sp. LEGE 07298]
MTTKTVMVATALLIAGSLAACDGRSPSSLQSPANPSVPLNAPGPPPPPEGAFLGQMSPTQTDQLTSLGVEVIVPGQVPPSFSIVEMRVDSSSSGPGYLVVYQSEGSQCFAVEFAATGIGDMPATEGRLPIQPPLFGDQGYGLNYGPFTDAELSAEFPQSNLFTDWLIGSSGAYRLIGATYIGDLFEALQGCEDVTPEEAVALAESLTVLTGDSMGEPSGDSP